MVWKYVNISDTGTASKFGADDLDKVGRAFSGIDVDDFDINLDCKIRSGKLQLRNPANTFSYIVTPAAIAADRQLNLPLITGTDTLAALGMSNTFTNLQIIARDGSSLFLDLNRTDNSIGDAVEINFNLQNSVNSQKNYGKISTSIVSSTDASEEGEMKFYTTFGGTNREVARIRGDGKLVCGGPNLRVILEETGLTATREFTFPDANSKLIGNDDTVVTLADGKDFTVGSINGTKIGTATTQKIGFFNKTPIVQKAANADTSGATLAALETEVNELKQLLRDYGLMA